MGYKEDKKGHTPEVSQACSRCTVGLTKWALGDIYDNCILLPKWQSKLVRRAAYDRKRIACGTWAGWFKCQVIEQQTRIKTLLMSSEFHLGSIRRLVEAEANTCSRERLRGREMRGYWTASPQNREDTGLCLSKSGLRVNSCKQQQLEDFIQRGGRISSYGDVRIWKRAVFVNQLEMTPDYRWKLDVNVDHWEIMIWVSKYF